MKNDKNDRKKKIDDTQVLPLEEIINMRRKISDIPDFDEDEIEPPKRTTKKGKNAFVLDTSDATELRRAALEKKEKEQKLAEAKDTGKKQNQADKLQDKGREETSKQKQDKEMATEPKAEAVENAGKAEHPAAEVSKDVVKTSKPEQIDNDQKQPDKKENKEEDKEPSSSITEKENQDIPVSKEEKKPDSASSETKKDNQEAAAQSSTSNEQKAETKQKAKEETQEELSKTMALDRVINKEIPNEEEPLTIEEKRKQKLAQKPTLEEKRSTQTSKETLEEKRKKDLEHALTLEEKRKQQLENKMTIEEKRAMAKQGIQPKPPKPTFKGYLHSLKALDIISLILLVVSFIMNGFLAWKIYTYFRMLYALMFFFTVVLLLGLTFIAMVKKRKLGLILNVLLVILLGAGSIVAMRFDSFADKVFDNSESETVMIVVKKDSDLSESSDLKDKRLAMIKVDGDTNTFAEEILSEHKKKGYIKEEYKTHKEAYEALMNEQCDMMVYTGLARQRLSEEEIDSWSNVKVIFQKNRQLTAIEGNKVDILKEPFTVFISGVDLTSESIDEKGSSDVNILLVVNPTTKKIMMQTIPRDTWAPLACSNDEHTKLTYAGAYGGTDCSIKTIEKYLGVEINYFSKINFKGVIDLVDALDGITVNSDVSFCESHPLDGYGVRDYCYNAGPNELSGVEALMFSRIRKVFSNGDIERGNHQMEVINAVVRKFKEEPSLTHLNSLISAVENNFTTNLAEDDLGKCLELFMSMSDQLESIESHSMEGEMVWNDDEITHENLYYFYPNEGQVEQAKERINAILEGK